MNDIIDDIILPFYISSTNCINRAPIKTLVEDRELILVYFAAGFTNDDIKYVTEFINKTQEMYLNISGEIEIESLNYKSSINIQHFIDTNTYEGFDINVDNGLLILTLYKKQNEATVLKGYGVK